MNPVRRILARLPIWTTPLIALVLLVAFTVVYEERTKGTSAFASPENVLNVLRQWSFVGILALGMTFVIALGGIDLSVGSLVAFLGGAGVLVLNAVLARGGGEGLAVAAAFALMFAGGVLAGSAHGLLVTRGRLAPFIATLGGLAIYRSLALHLADGGEYRAASEGLFGALGAGGIPIPGTNVAPAWSGKVVPLVFPWPVAIFLGLAAVAWVALDRTRYGRYVLAIGSNATAARYSALPVERIQVRTYATLGACAGLAAFLLAGRMNSVSSSGTGVLYELDVIAAVVIGGTRMRGGSATILGTVVGVLVLGVIGNMLNLLQVGPYLQGLVKGLVILGAVLLQRAESAD